jgi:nucleoside-diphosphate-sugar epimerase
MMRVLLTGASGFIGRYVLGCLQNHGISTVVAGRSLPASISHTDFIRVDLLDRCDLGKLVAESRATHLLHLAWYAEHGKYWTSPLNLRWTEATIRLVEAFCLSGGQKVVVAGTCAEYDWSHGYCREDITPTNPVTLYGIAKDATRRLTMAVCAEYKVPAVWGRIFLPYGQGEDNRRLIPSLIEVFRGKRAPFGVNATVYRDFLRAADLAEGFVRLLQEDAAGIYNICSGQPTQIGDIVRHIAHSLSADPSAVLVLSTERPDEPGFLVGDNQKLTALSWKPELSLASILDGRHMCSVRSPREIVEM